jgi:hypothetical protein
MSCGGYFDSALSLSFKHGKKRILCGFVFQSVSFKYGKKNTGRERSEDGTVCIDN